MRRIDTIQTPQEFHLRVTHQYERVKEEGPCPKRVVGQRDVLLFSSNVNVHVH